LLCVCRKVFPAEAELRVHSIEPRVNRNSPHQDYDFQLDGDDTHFRLILRLHHGLFSVWGGTEKIKSAKVFSVMRHVYQQGIAAPFPYLFDASQKPFGWPYLVMDPGDGTRWWEGPDSLRQVQEQYAEAMAEELAKLHTHVNPEHPLLPRVDVRSLLRQLKTRTRSLEDEELERCFKGCAIQLNEIAGLTPVVLHGQYDVDQVLISNGRIRTILNWENAAIGDPRWDLAHASLSLEREHDRSVSNRFLARYAQVSGIPAEDIAFWEGVIALRAFALSRWLRSLDERSFKAIMGRQINLFCGDFDYRKRALKQFG